jgi:hypothetical protein
VLRAGVGRGLDDSVNDALIDDVGVGLDDSVDEGLFETVGNGLAVGLCDAVKQKATISLRLHSCEIVEPSWLFVFTDISEDDGNPFVNQQSEISNLRLRLYPLISRRFPLKMQFVTLIP